MISYMLYDQYNSLGQTCVELWMVMDALDVHLHVGEGLCVAVHVPLPQPDPQLLRPGDMGSIFIKK